MGYKFNPFTGNFDITDSPDGVFDSVEVNGDINLDDGGSFTTTVQCVTPTQNRTISFPDATGTVALVAGSSGQLVYNNAGSNAGATGSVVDSSGNVTIGGLTTLAGSPSANNTSGVLINGTWRTGASSNNPQLLLNPSGTTLSTTWSPSGTGIGVNAPASFGGNLLDLQVNGTSQFRVNQAGVILSNGDNIRVLGATSSANFQVSAPQNNNSAIQFSYSGTATSVGTSVGYIGRINSHYGFFDGSGGIQFVLPSGATDRFAFFGTTSSFPALKRNAAVLETKLADDSAYAQHAASVFRAATAHTVATLPGTPAVGMIARVTDATAPAVGSTVTGGGAAAALVWYNGANWTVIGV